MRRDHSNGPAVRTGASMGRKLCLALLTAVALYTVYAFVMRTPTAPVVEKDVPVMFDFGNDPTFKKEALYLKSTWKPTLHDVTLTTQASVDRLDRVVNLATMYGGPISASIYVKDEAQDKATITTLYNENPVMSQFVDIHLVHTNKTRYPVNVLRNYAIQQSRTKHVFILDADFVTSEDIATDLRAALEDVMTKDYDPLTGQWTEWDTEENWSKAGLAGDDEDAGVGRTHWRREEMKKRDKSRAFVVPAFQSKSEVEQPKNKKEMLMSIQKNTVQPVNLHPCPKCHTPTDYPRWYVASEPYSVEYHWIYEPYLVFHKDYAPPFDEKLKGYGFDKNTHSFQLAIMGYTFYVLPRPFVTHIAHPETSWDGPKHKQQQYDSLKIVCERFVELRREFGFPEDKPVFDEPMGAFCLTDKHW